MISNSHIINDEPYRIAAYCRISVDDELNKENTSIENQKSIISDYVFRSFPNAKVDYFIDRDRIKDYLRKLRNSCEEMLHQIQESCK